MQSKVKVMLFTSWLGLGGTERSIFNLARLLDKTRFEVCIYCFSHKGYFGLEAEKAGIRVLSGGFDFRLRSLFQSCRRFLRTLREERVEILHCLGYPTIYYGVVLGVIGKTPRILSVVRDDGTWKSWSHLFWDGIVDEYADLIIANSQLAERNYLRRKSPVLARKVATIYCGIDASGLSCNTANQLAGEGAGPTVGLIGRLDDAMKGHSVFFRAAKLVADQRPGVKFCVIGDGPDREKLESLATELGLARRLVFAGGVTDLQRAYGMVDIVVIPSRSESLPHVLLEAMCSGKSIVASAVGEIPFILGERYASLIVPKDNPPVLAQKLMDLIDHPESIAHNGAEARRRFEELGLTAERCARETEKVYTSLLSTPPAVHPISRKLLMGIGGFLLLETYWATRRRLGFGRLA